MVVVPPYSGWKPRGMRMGKGRHESERSAKRNRLGNPRDRFVYISAHGHRQFPTHYALLCKRVDSLPGNRR